LDRIEREFHDRRALPERGVSYSTPPLQKILLSVPWPSSLPSNGAF